VDYGKKKQVVIMLATSHNVCFSGVVRDLVGSFILGIRRTEKGYTRESGRVTVLNNFKYFPVIKITKDWTCSKVLFCSNKQ
jgi:hypothetical protein